MKRVRVPDDFQQSLDRWRSEGLTNGEIAEALRIAQDRFNDDLVDDPWKYAAGICWGMIVDKMSIKNVIPVITEGEM